MTASSSDGRTPAAAAAVDPMEEVRSRRARIAASKQARRRRAAKAAKAAPVEESDRADGDPPRGRPTFVAPTRLSAWGWLSGALGCGALGLWLALHYPVLPMAALALWLALVVAGFVGWQSLPMLVPALVPVIGLAPWTGWITFEELDLLVLALATGGYAALALTRPAGRPVAWRFRTLRWRSATQVLLAVFALSVLISVWRGMAPAGGLHFGWWQGYQEPMNSVRLGKSLGLVLLLLPLWQRASDLRPAAVQRLARAAWVAALVLASLAALWERWRYTGLLDFSSDYRTTGGFWEMHVGGAALDGCLAIAVPMALLWALRERQPARFGAAVAVLLLAFYASLTTFSRGVYLAVPAGLVICAWMWTLQRRHGVPEEAAAPAYVPVDAALPMRWTIGLLVGVAATAWALFGTGGYRGLLALAGSTAVWVALPAPRAAWPVQQTRVALLLAPWPGLLVVLLAWALSDQVDKLVYVVDGVLVLLGLLLCLLWRQGLTNPTQLLVLAACWTASLAGAGLVALHWGEGRDALTVVLVLALLGLAGLATLWSGSRRVTDLRQTGWRVRGLVWTLCLLVCGVVAALGGGGYIGQRMSTGQQDFDGRLHHWSIGLSLLNGTDEWLLGKGAGRFPSAFAFGGPYDERVGDYRWVDGAVGSAEPPRVMLSSGLHQLGHGELFRISQRLGAVSGQVGASVTLRTQQKTQLRVEICEKHLLYPLRCIDREIEVQPRDGAWQTVQLPLGTAPADFGGPRWSPRRLTAAVALNWRGSLVEIASVRLVDAAHGPLLRNEDFSGGMAHWFFSSDKYHMPWHMKSLPLHVLFEQGLLGVALWAGLLATAVWRCTWGAARRHPLAPAVVGGLAGFLIVGLFDSLIDAPRIGFLFYAMLALALGLRAPSRRRPGEEIGVFETGHSELDSQPGELAELPPHMRRRLARAVGR